MKFTTITIAAFSLSSQVLALPIVCVNPDLSCIDVRDISTVVGEASGITAPVAPFFVLEADPILKRDIVSTAVGTVSGLVAPVADPVISKVDAIVERELVAGAVGFVSGAVDAASPAVDPVLGEVESVVKKDVVSSATGLVSGVESVAAPVADPVLGEVESLNIFKKAVSPVSTIVNSVSTLKSSVQVQLTTLSTFVIHPGPHGEF